MVFEILSVIVYEFFFRKILFCIGLDVTNLTVFTKFQYVEILSVKVYEFFLLDLIFFRKILFCIHLDGTNFTVFAKFRYLQQFSRYCRLKFTNSLLDLIFFQKVIFCIGLDDTNFIMISNEIFIGTFCGHIPNTNSSPAAPVRVRQVGKQIFSVCGLSRQGLYKIELFRKKSGLTKKFVSFNPQYLEN